jgi:hypothetical protein
MGNKEGELNKSNRTNIPGVIATLIMVISLSLPLGVHAANATASLVVAPTNQKMNKGDTLDVDIQLNSGGQAVAGSELTIMYSKNMRYDHADATDSIFATEVTPAKNQDNTITLSRVRTDTGYNGIDGRIVRLAFVATDTGDAFVNIDASKSKVLSYGDSSNILQASVNGVYTISSSSTSPLSSQAMQILGVVILLVLLTGVVIALLRVKQHRRYTDSRPS